MPTRNSQILIWFCVALLTLGAHTAVLYLVRFPSHSAPEQITPPVRLDLTILQPTPAEDPSAEDPSADAIPAPQSKPTPEPEPQREPEPTPETISEPEPTPEVAPPPVAPPPPPEPKPDPAIIQKQRAEKDARDAARKRLEEKRRKEKVARDQATRAAARTEASAQKRAALAKQIRTKAIPTSLKKPTYPRSAQKAGHQGTTVLRITIGITGRVTSARIKQSSSHSTLDRAALSVVRYWRFTPATNGLGQKIPYTTDAPIPFKLR